MTPGEPAADPLAGSTRADEVVAELTAHDLLARRGWGSFAKWMRATSLAGGDGEKAFRSTYGEGASAYASAASTRLLREVQDMYTR